MLLAAVASNYLQQNATKKKTYSQNMEHENGPTSKIHCTWTVDKYSA